MTEWIRYRKMLEKAKERAGGQGTQTVIEFYRELIGLDCLDKGQDALFYPRFLRSATKIFNALHGDITLCCLAMIETREKQYRDKLNWTLDTVVKMLPQWMGDRNRKEECKKREQEFAKQELEEAESITAEQRHENKKFLDSLLGVMNNEKKG